MTDYEIDESVETPLERSGREARERSQKSAMTPKAWATVCALLVVGVIAAVFLGGLILTLVLLGVFAAITGRFAYWGIR